MPCTILLGPFSCRLYLVIQKFILVLPQSNKTPVRVAIYFPLNSQKNCGTGYTPLEMRTFCVVTTIGRDSAYVRYISLERTYESSKVNRTRIYAVSTKLALRDIQKATYMFHDK